MIKPEKTITLIMPGCSLKPGIFNYFFALIEE